MAMQRGHGHTAHRYAYAPGLWLLLLLGCLKRHFFQLCNSQIQQLHAVAAEVDIGARIRSATLDVDNDAFAEFLMKDGFADAPGNVFVGKILCDFVRFKVSHLIPRRAP